MTAAPACVLTRQTRDGTRTGADRAAEADLDDENMPLSDSLTIPTPPIDTDSTSTLHGLQEAHSRANAHGDDDNELHMGLSALRKHVISQVGRQHTRVLEWVVAVACSQTRCVRRVHVCTCIYIE